MNWQPIQYLLPWHLIFPIPSVGFPELCWRSLPWKQFAKCPFNRNQWDDWTTRTSFFLCCSAFHFFSGPIDCCCRNTGKGGYLLLFISSSSQFALLYKCFDSCSARLNFGGFLQGGLIWCVFHCSFDLSLKSWSFSTFPSFPPPCPKLRCKKWQNHHWKQKQRQ